MNKVSVKVAITNNSPVREYKVGAHMFCTYCQQSRVENQAPCPNCGAPSPLLQVSGIGQWGTNNSAGALSSSKAWGGSSISFNDEASWEQASMNQPIQEQSIPTGSRSQWDAPVPQLSFDTTPSPLPPLNPSWSQLSPGASSQIGQTWQETGVGRQEGQAGSQSLLPMIYQGGMPQATDMRQSTVSLQLIPDHAVEHLLPGMSVAPESVYVPPLYTKPRPLVPRYRIISGFISVFVVVLLLCTGAGYYAKASGKLGTVINMFTGRPPRTVMKPATVQLADPPNKIDTGPAINIIPSGTTTLRIDQNNIALEIDKVFMVNQLFYVTYSVQPPAGQNGKVSVKWYMNGQFYRLVTSDKVIKGGGPTMNGSAPMQYAQPAEGSVEIYWNDQLSERFYFVVRAGN